MQCESCRKIVPSEHIKLVPKTMHVAMCNVCRGEVPDEPEPAHMFVERIDELPDRLMFYCNRCQYKFRHNPKGAVKLYCPWCGDADQVSQLQ